MNRTQMKAKVMRERVKLDKGRLSRKKLTDPQKMIALDRFLIQFGPILDEYMRNRKLGDLDVGRACDIHYSAIYRIKKKLRYPGIDTIIKICRGLFYNQGLPVIPYPYAPRPNVPGKDRVALERKIKEARTKKRKHIDKMRRRKQRRKTKIDQEVQKRLRELGIKVTTRG